MDTTNHETSSSSPPKVTSLRTLGLLSVGLSALVSILVIYAIHAGMKQNPIRLPLENEVNAQLWLPEGWKFFTRDPREERTSMFVRNDEGWQNVARTPNANPRNSFGLDRLGRAQGLEVGLVLGAIPTSAWTPCDGDVVACFEHAETSIKVTNISPNPSLCGAVALLSQKPVPWAWASAHMKVAMPAHIVRLEVQC